MRKAGAQVKYPVSLPKVEEMRYKGKSGIDMVGCEPVLLLGCALSNNLVAQFKNNLRKFLADLDDVSIKSIDELVKYNEEHAESCMPERNVQ